MTQELLQARAADLEARMEEQRQVQARGQADIERIQRRVNRARDEENAIGGALQDCRYWLTVLAKSQSPTATQPEGAAPDA